MEMSAFKLQGITFDPRYTVETNNVMQQPQESIPQKKCKTYGRRDLFEGRTCIGQISVFIPMVELGNSFSTLRYGILRAEALENVQNGCLKFY